MKKLLLPLLALCAMICSPKAAAQSVLGELGILNHVAVSAHVATTGYGFEASVPITRFLQLRGGVSIMPDFSFKTDVDGEINVPQIGSQNINIDLEGKLGRTQTSLILNVYPFPVGSFFLAGGFYFGGQDLVKIQGHSEEAARLSAAGFLEVGDYKLPIDSKGNVDGCIRVKKTRPYLGLGFGRSVPKGRLGFMFELGVQFHDVPKIYTIDGGKYTELSESGLNNDDDFQKIIDKLKVYPVMKLTLTGRIF